MRCAPVDAPEGTAARPMAPPDLQHQASDGGVQVEMLVGVHMVQRQSGGGEGRELGLDLRGELATHRRAEEEIHPGPDHVLAEEALAIDEVRHPLRRQHWPALDQDQMEPDAQARQTSSPGDGIARPGLARHQACRRQNAVPVGLLDGLVDLARQPEVIGRDDELLQLAISLRSRRKWKNSTPSRRRRFIICGLRTISETMEAILPERK